MIQQILHETISQALVSMYKKYLYYIITLYSIERNMYIETCACGKSKDATNT